MRLCCPSVASARPLHIFVTAVACDTCLRRIQVLEHGTTCVDVSSTRRLSGHELCGADIQRIFASVLRTPSVQMDVYVRI